MLAYGRGWIGGMMKYKHDVNNPLSIPILAKPISNKEWKRIALKIGLDAAKFIDKDYPIIVKFTKRRNWTVVSPSP